MSQIEGPVLGVPALDAPHADLLQRAADLAAATQARRDREAAAILEGLVEASARHFAFEEEAMEQTVYPDRAAHRAAHDLFLQDLHASAIEVGQSGVTPRVTEWASGRLQQWLRFHMEVNDRPLARHLQRRASPPGTHPSLRRS
jgi:hemerythrin